MYVWVVPIPSNMNGASNLTLAGEDALWRKVLGR